MTAAIELVGVEKSFAGGAGPVAVKKVLEPFLPVPRVVQREAKFVVEHNHPQSIGRVKSFFGNFGMLVRAYTYIREMGPEGLKAVTELAVLNANYVRSLLDDVYSLAYEKPSMHEVVFTDKKLKKETGVQTLDVAKMNPKNNQQKTKAA